MNKSIKLIFAVLILALTAGCVTSSKPIRTIPAARPAWIDDIPTDPLSVHFVGLSRRQSTERDARNESQDNGRRQLVNYYGTQIQTKVMEYSDFSGVSNDILSSNILVEQLDTYISDNIAQSLQARSFYTEVFLDNQKQEVYITYVLMNIDRDRVNRVIDNYGDTRRNELTEAARKETDAERKRQLEEAAQFFTESFSSVLSEQKEEADRALQSVLNQQKQEAERLAKVETERAKVTDQQTLLVAFVRVEGGAFLMGSNNDSEKLVHSVTVKSFYMGKYLVTQKEWREVMGNNPSHFKGDTLPVESISWNEAVEYCNRRSQKEGLTPAYRGSGNSITCDWSANGYRLPTEAEWEYAARGGNGSPGNYTYSGSNDVDSVAWYSGNSGNTTHPVGTKTANSLGIYDMSGNVYEWCWDWYGSYSSSAQTDPRGASSGSNRVQRGGGWINPAVLVHSAFRVSNSPSARVHNLGFRLVRRP